MCTGLICAKLKWKKVCRPDGSSSKRECAGCEGSRVILPALFLTLDEYSSWSVGRVVPMIRSAVRTTLRSLLMSDLVVYWCHTDFWETSAVKFMLIFCISSQITLMFAHIQTLHVAMHSLCSLCSLLTKFLLNGKNSMNMLQAISFYVLQKQDSHSGLQWHRDE